MSASDVAVATGAAASVRRRWLAPDAWLGAAGVAAVFAAWDAAIRLGLVSPVALPEPWGVLRAVAALAVDPSFVRQAGDTLGTWLLAMLLACAIAIPAGLLMGYIAALYRPASTVVHAARSVPASSLIPLAILLFGLETPMKAAVALYAITWPLLLNTMYGVHAVDGQLITTGRSLGWGRRKLLARVILPSAAPSILTGLRLAGALALVVVISAEMLGARYGIGTELILYQEAQRPAYVYAGILIVGALGVLIFYTLSAVERAATPWAHAQRRGSR